MAKIGGAEIQEIVKQYPTPLYVYDEGMIRSRISEFCSSFASDLFETKVVYASKAFSCKAMVRLVSEYGCGVDVVSAGELVTAVSAGFDPSGIVFHGNNKTPYEIDLALAHHVGTIVVDNLQEAQFLVSKADESDPVHALLRVNPGVEAHTHKYIVTAHVDSKFGISFVNEEELVQTIRVLEECPGVVFDGLHAHIGSQIFEKQAYEAEIHAMFAFSAKMKEKYGIVVHTLNFGGGFGAVYTDEDHPIAVKDICERIVEKCAEENEALHTDVRRLMIEPGRSIVAEAGYTLYTAGYQKQTPNRTYLFVDGGMSDNIRPALYQAKYDAFIDGREAETKTVQYTVAGKCCESGDILIDSIALPQAQQGDILVLKTTGAYGYSMASNYNKLTFPGVVFVRDGVIREVIRRQTIEDLISREI